MSQASSQGSSQGLSEELASDGLRDDLDEIERMAIELATLAGAEIVTTFGGIFTVRYKTGDAGKLSVRDPVSEVDRRVEALIRTRLAERFPTHDIIGEEMEERPGRGQDYVGGGSNRRHHEFRQWLSDVCGIDRRIARWCSDHRCRLVLGQPCASRGRLSRGGGTKAAVRRRRCNAEGQRGRASPSCRRSGCRRRRRSRLGDPQDWLRRA